MARPHGGAMSDSVRDVIIIGSGPAGYTAGPYNGLRDAQPTHVRRVRLRRATYAHHRCGELPRYPTGVSGPEMMVQELREQAERFGLEVHDKDVTSINTATRPFEVEVEGTIHRARSLIISTGAQARWLDAEGEEEQKGRGISTCATRDGAFFRTIMSSSLEAVIQRWRKPRS